MILDCYKMGLTRVPTGPPSFLTERLSPSPFLLPVPPAGPPSPAKPLHQCKCPFSSSLRTRQLTPPENHSPRIPSFLNRKL